MKNLCYFNIFKLKIEAFQAFFKFESILTWLSKRTFHLKKKTVAPGKSINQSQYYIRVSISKSLPDVVKAASQNLHKCGLVPVCVLT